MDYPTFDPKHAREVLGGRLDPTNVPLFGSGFHAQQSFDISGFSFQQKDFKPKEALHDELKAAAQLAYESLPKVEHHYSSSALEDDPPSSTPEEIQNRKKLTPLGRSNAVTSAPEELIKCNLSKALVQKKHATKISVKFNFDLEWPNPLLRRMWICDSQAIINNLLRGDASALRTLLLDTVSRSIALIKYKPAKIVVLERFTVKCRNGYVGFSQTSRIDTSCQEFDLFDMHGNQVNDTPTCVTQPLDTPSFDSAASSDEASDAGQVDNAQEKLMPLEAPSFFRVSEVATDGDVHERLAIPGLDSLIFSRSFAEELHVIPDALPVDDMPPQLLLELGGSFAEDFCTKLGLVSPERSRPVDQVFDDFEHAMRNIGQSSQDSNGFDHESSSDGSDTNEDASVGVGDEESDDEPDEPGDSRGPDDNDEDDDHDDSDDHSTPSSSAGHADSSGSSGSSDTSCQRDSEDSPDQCDSSETSDESFGSSGNDVCSDSDDSPCYNELSGHEDSLSRDDASGSLATELTDANSFGTVTLPSRTDNPGENVEFVGRDTDRGARGSPNGDDAADDVQLPPGISDSSEPSGSHVPVELHDQGDSRDVSSIDESSEYPSQHEVSSSSSCHESRDVSVWDTLDTAMAVLRRGKLWASHEDVFGVKAPTTMGNNFDSSSGPNSALLELSPGPDNVVYLGFPGYAYLPCLPIYRIPPLHTVNTPLAPPVLEASSVPDITTGRPPLLGGRTRLPSRGPPSQTELYNAGFYGVRPPQPPLRQSKFFLASHASAATISTEEFIAIGHATPCWCKLGSCLHRESDAPASIEPPEVVPSESTSFDTESSDSGILPANEGTGSKLETTSEEVGNDIGSVPEQDTPAEQGASNAQPDEQASPDERIEEAGSQSSNVDPGVQAIPVRGLILLSKWAPETAFRQRYQAQHRQLLEVPSPPIVVSLPARIPACLADSCVHSAETPEMANYKYAGGYRTAARLPAPHTAQDREWLKITPRATMTKSRPIVPSHSTPPRPSATPTKDPRLTTDHDRQPRQNKPTLEETPTTSTDPPKDRVHTTTTKGRSIDLEASGASQSWMRDLLQPTDV